MSVETRKLSALKPHPKNPKQHPDSQVAGIGDSITEFGVTRAIVVDEHDMVLAGHGQRLAGMKRGITEMPVFVARGWSDDKKLAFMLADNRWAEVAGYDDALLRENVAALKLAGFNLALAGYTPPDVAELLAKGNDGVADAETVPEPRPTKIRKGDLWMLGGHRLLCGDSTLAEEVARVMGDDRPNLMVTDPPYGVEYDPGWRTRAGVSLNQKKMGKVSNDDRADWREAWALFPGDVAYVWHAGRHASTVEASLDSVSFGIVAQIIWAKDRMALSRGDYHWQHEPCWYAVRAGKKHSWAGGRDKTTLWQIPSREDSGHGHGTQKPIECMKRPIENNSRKGEFIYEPFAGSGTTIIACEQVGRKCIAVELDPVYVQMCIERWEKFTGLKATMDGNTLEQVTAARTAGRPKRPERKCREARPEKL